MTILGRELDELVDAVAPAFFDLEQLERLVTADELAEFEGDCDLHAGCQPVSPRRNAAG